MIRTLKLINYRNYNKLELDFDNNKNIIIGNNGSGKTNIIEAIHYLSLTKSFRSVLDNDLIKKDMDFFFIEAKILKDIENIHRVVYKKTTNEKILKIDNNTYKVGDYVSRFNVVLFSHEDLKLVKDNPSIHRKLINMEISQFDNKYLKLLGLYNKVLKQRNFYLRSMQTNSLIPKDYLNILTDKLIDLGLEIFEIRKSFIDNINNHIEKIFYRIN